MKPTTRTQVCIGALVISLAGLSAGCAGAPTRSTTRGSSTPATAAASPKTMSPRECKVQAVPKCDGTFRVSGDLSSTGILPGWIQTEGVAPGKATCSWARLSSATFSLASTIDGGSAKADDLVQPIRVQVQPSDHSFYTKGCLPWRKVG